VKKRSRFIIIKYTNHKYSLAEDLRQHGVKLVEFSLWFLVLPSWLDVLLQVHQWALVLINIPLLSWCI